MIGWKTNGVDNMKTKKEIIKSKNRKFFISLFLKGENR